MTKFYNGCYDVVFKTVICDENNPNMLKTFLEHILHIPIDTITFLRNELMVGDVKERKKTVDLLVKSGNQYIHVELNKNYKDYHHVRNFCFFTNNYSTKTRSGDEYDLTSEFIHIDLSYGLNDTKEIREYYVMDEDGSLYIENMKIIEFNMDMITNYWYTSNKEKIEEYKYLIMLGLDREALDELSKGDKYMQEYTKRVEKLNDNNAFTSWITAEEDERLILNTEKRISYNEGIDQGIEQGLEQGMQQEKVAVAKNLLKSAVDIKVIMNATGLSKEQIEELA